MRRIRVFENTVLSSTTAIFISSNVNVSFQQLVRGNAVFGATAISGGTQADNVTGNFASAANFLNNPSGIVSGPTNRMDLHPQTGMLVGPAIDASPIATYVDANRDFNDRLRDHTVRGAYGTQGANPGWQLALEIKVLAAGDAVFANGFEAP